MGDGYDFGKNNYRIYHDPKKDKITFLPSGMDQMMGDTNWPILMNFGGRIARKVIDTPECWRGDYQLSAQRRSVVIIGTPA